LTSAVMRVVLHRSFRRRHQALRAAMACSPSARILAGAVDGLLTCG